MGWRFPHALRATWELHASVHEPTRGTSLFQICVTAFAYISILSCFSVLCVVFSSFFFCLSSELQRRRCRLVAPPFSAGPLAAMLQRTHRQDLSLCWWIKPFYPIMNDHVRIQSDILRSRTGADEKSPPDNTCWFLQLPTLSVAPCFAFTQLVESHLLWLTMSLIFPPPSLFLDKHFELYIGKYCIRLQYSCS